MSKQQISCTSRFLQPFIELLGKYPTLQGEVELARTVPHRSRIDLASFHDLVSRWVRVTRDPDLGLRAGRRTTLGACGALDYALRSAPTLGESIHLARRHARLYSDVLEFALARQPERATVRIGGPFVSPRALTDFILSTWYRNHLLPHLDEDAALECSFTYPEPASIDLHRSVFGEVRLAFGATFNGFSFATHLLARELESADAALHELHCEQLARTDALAAQAEPLAMRARRVLSAELRSGQPPTSSILARRLRMSRRTLVRKLALEGTSYTAVLDGLRRQRATSLVLEGSLPLAAISRSLGFSHVQGFHRSFRRWTGMSPRRYRDTNLRGPAAASV